VKVTVFLSPDSAHAPPTAAPLAVTVPVYPGRIAPLNVAETGAFAATAVAPAAGLEAVITGLSPSGWKTTSTP